MPKMKTHKATKKRFRLSRYGESHASRSWHQPLGISHEPQRKRNLRGTRVLAKPQTRQIHDCLRGNSY